MEARGKIDWYKIDLGLEYARRYRRGEDTARILFDMANRMARQFVMLTLGADKEEQLEEQAVQREVALRIVALEEWAEDSLGLGGYVNRMVEALLEEHESHLKGRK